MSSQAGGNPAQPGNSDERSGRKPESGEGVSSTPAIDPKRVEKISDKHCRLPVKVVNSMGIHVRPASLIAGLCMKYPCNIWVSKGEERVNGKSVLQLISLQADMGTDLLLEAEGDEALAALVDLGSLVQRGFNDELAN